MPQVHNKMAGTAPKDAIYIGRGSKWGNPYSHKKGTKADEVVSTREEAIATTKYRQYLEEHPELKEAAKKELKGKDLVCFCKPAACRGDILLEVASS